MTTRPRTVHLTNFYHRHSGGISAFYNALFQCANQQRRQMNLIVPGESDGCEPVGEYGRIHYVKAGPSPWIDKRYRLIFPLFPSGRRALRIIIEEQPDILEVSDKYTLLYLSGLIRKHLVRGAGRPTEIATSHERMDDNFAAHIGLDSIGQRFVRWYLRRIYFPMFDHHIANSPYTAHELIPASKGHTTRRGIWVSPMGVDSQFFQDAAGVAEQHAGARRHPGRLVYAGRTAREKNVHLLIDVMELLPEFSLVVAGRGPEQDRFLAEASRRVPGRVQVIGHIGDRSQFAALLRSAEAFVHPNPHEPFGITLLEAMASGTPVVAPRSGGVLAYASDRNAWLCSPDAQSFASAIRSVCSDSALRARRIETARRTAKDHDWSLTAARYFDLLDRIHAEGWRISVPPLGCAHDAWEAARHDKRVGRRRTGVHQPSAPAAAHRLT